MGLAGSLCASATAFPAGAQDAHAIRELLRTTPVWHVAWSPPDEQRQYLAVVTFQERGGILMAESAHPGGVRCYPAIRVEVHDWGFLFHGCTGVPKEMRHDPRDPGTPFKGRAFGFTYRWTPVSGRSYGSSLGKEGS
jgi:hypothetical protein